MYRVTVETHGGTRDVTVRVTDVDEAGTVVMDRPQPQVDRPLEASLFDEDEGVTDERWQWSRSEEGRNWKDIEGASSPGRSPTAADVSMLLRATVTYADRFGMGKKTASAVSAYRVEARTLVNAAPSLDGQAEDEATPHIDVARSVPENTAVGTGHRRAGVGDGRRRGTCCSTNCWTLPTWRMTTVMHGRYPQRVCKRSVGVPSL